MDGKFQGIMHMPYNFMFRMVITNGEVLLTLRLNRSKNTKYSKIMTRLSMRRTDHKCTQGVIRVHFVFDVTLWEIEGKTCGR